MSEEHSSDTARGPLSGLRVVELAGMGVVPYAAMILGDLGADVVRIDRTTPGVLDAPENLAAGRPVDFVIRRSRRSIAIDLKAQQGADVVLKLVEGADALIEGYRPGVADRLGIGPKDCQARNPSLVYVRATGWGQTGPYAQAPGHDLNYVGLSGALLAIGRRDTPPAPPLNLIGDFAGGAMFAVIGLLSALVRARETGTGDVIDASMVDGIAHLVGLYHGMLQTGAWSEEREANTLDGGSPLYDVYETRDGGYMSVAAGEPQFQAGLFDELGLTDEFSGIEVTDPANWPQVRAGLAARFRSRCRDEWIERLAGRSDVCCAPVLSFTESLRNEHFRARGTFVTVDGVVQPGPVPRFQSSPPEVKWPPPRPGQHSAEVLGELGYSSQAIEKLFTSGTVLQG